MEITNKFWKDDIFDGIYAHNPFWLHHIFSCTHFFQFFNILQRDIEPNICAHNQEYFGIYSYKELIFRTLSRYFICRIGIGPKRPQYTDRGHNGKADGIYDRIPLLYCKDYHIKGDNFHIQSEGVRT